MTEIEYAETPGGRLAYVRRGSGEPLLLIMGVAGHHAMWSELFLERLGEHFDVVAFDHRGIGTSHYAEPGFTIPDLADDAAAVMDHLGWDSAHVMGISMGGVTAQELVLRHPERVRRLVLGCTWPGPGPADVWGPGTGKIAAAAGGDDPMAAARLMFEANVSQEFAGRPGEFEKFTEIAASEQVPGPVILMQMRAATRHDAIERLADVTAPTLVVHGTADEIILPDGGQRLAELIPGAKLDLWDGVGHVFYWEQPDRAADAVIAHLVG